MVSHTHFIRTSLTVLTLAALCGEGLAQADPDRKAMSDARIKRAEILFKRHNMNDANARAAVVRQLKDAEAALEAAAHRRARARGIPIEGKKPDGRGFRLIDFDENDQPVYEQDENANAAISTAANEVRSVATYNSVTGSGVTIGLWEASGIPRLTHQELTGRVTVLDGSTTEGSHATHVAGTLIATGINANVKGMAPGAGISAFTTSQADAEMTSNGASAPNTSKLYVSNHSYGVGQGWEASSSSEYDWVFQGTFVNDDNPGTDYDPDFGRYSSSSVTWDGITYNLPYYLPFISSGNHKSDNPTDGQKWSHGGVIYTYDSTKHPAGDGDYKNNYDNMEGRKLAKNVISVGNTNDAVNNGVRDPSKAVTQGSSSRGPADDGRIKPDIVANGASLTSSESGGNTATSVKSGTSMATPNACGSAALLINYYTSRFPTQSMRASSLKALILHTADDRGNTGPDYKYGWGLMNTKSAADVIKMHADNNGGARMLESAVSTSVTSRTHTFAWNGASPLRVTLCWTDPAGTEKSGHENRTKALVNDLNLTVTRLGGTTHYPYVMPHVGNWSVASIESNATTGVNTVDNVEQVYLAAPASGTYVVTVNYAGALTNGSQDYSLIVTGQTAAEIEVEENGSPVVPLADNSGVRDFGAAAPSAPSVLRTYTLRNTGGSPLTGLAVAKSGAHSGDFTVGALSKNELSTGETATFTVSYDPLGTGTRTASLQIASNDSDENPFDIHLTATGLTELEAWRFTHFGTTANTGSAASGFDGDKDGLVNLLEFGLATSPTVADPQPLAMALAPTQAQLSYQRSVAAMTDHVFEVIWSDDLSSGSWTTAGVVENIVSDNGTVQQIQATLPAGSAAQRFFRIRMREN